MHWYFVAGAGLDFAVMNEVASEALLDEAYPDVAGGVAAFVGRYSTLRSGPCAPGAARVGQDRLLRAILGNCRGVEARRLAS